MTFIEFGNRIFSFVTYIADLSTSSVPKVYSLSNNLGQMNYFLLDMTDSPN